MFTLTLESIISKLHLADNNTNNSEKNVFDILILAGEINAQTTNKASLDVLFLFAIKITSTFPSNREYIISNNNQQNENHQIYISMLVKTMFIKLNKITLYANFNKRKENI